MVDGIKHAPRILGGIHNQRFNRLQGLKHQSNVPLPRILCNRTQH